MFSAFFIDRPIFASVLSIVIALAGTLALTSLPVAQYPEITPPQVQVAINYPGASAQVVADTVAAPIEQQVNGVTGMLYMSSQSGNDGSYTLSVTFDIGTDLNTALVMVQNRVTLAMPQLPTDVQRQGITIRKKTPDVLQLVSFTSPDGRYGNIYLSNFALISVRDELLRVDGVSDVNMLGERDYSIRVWLDPQKLAARNLTAIDVANAIRAQNIEAAPGQVAVPPAAGRPAFQFPLDTLGRLSDPGVFGDIIVKAGPAPHPPAFAPVTASASAPSAGGLGAPSVRVSNSTALGTTSSRTIGLSGFRTSGFSLSRPISSGGSTLNMPYLAPSTSGSGMSSAAAFGGGSASTSASGSANPSGPAPTASSAASTGTSTFSIDTVMSRLAARPVISASIATVSDLTTVPPAGSSNPNATGSLVGPDSLQGGGLAAGPWPAAGIVRLRDVARIELGAQNYNSGAMLDGTPAVSLVIHLLPGANALDTADRIRAKMEELRPRFPDGVEYSIPYDTTPYIRESVWGVVQTLLEAIGLVAVVVLVFLQSWRASIIPLVAVPVAILGTFAVMAVVGFSLNNISLFGLVLAIGIVVDDAIVVVENVQRWLDEGLAPHEAARKAMAEVTGPVVAIALVLCAVFVPCAFISGITGQFFRQFAVTIAASTLISAFNSLTLSPALAALLLKPKNAPRDVATRIMDVALGWFFRLFNRGFAAGTTGYAWAVGRLLRVSVVVLLVYAGLLYLTYHEFTSTPTGFVPQQDKGYLLVNVQLPDSSSVERTQKVLAHLDDIVFGPNDPKTGERDADRGIPGVAHTVGISGQSLVQNANAPNLGSVYVMLQPFAQRTSANQTADAIAATIQERCQKEVRGAVVSVAGAPPIEGLGTTGGFKLVIEDRGNLGTAELQRVSDQVVADAKRTPGLVRLSNSSRSDAPWRYLQIDRTECESLGVLVSQVFDALQYNFGSYYVNNFNEFGRNWQVNVQADPLFRDRVRDIRELQVRNNQGQMLPLGSVLSVRATSGPVLVQRYNMYSAAFVTGDVAAGTSTGQAVPLMDQIAGRDLPRAMASEWTELTFLQNQAGNSALYAFALAVVFVFLVLAAQYESWKLPLAVVLVVPMCLLFAVVGVNVAGQDVSIFTQVGFIVLVGLACKNAILIVEFARQKQDEGMGQREAAVEASRLRIRPILMTSFAFILGVVPLLYAQGAGAEMRQSLGTAVFSGMLGVTLFGIFLTPVFYSVIQWFGRPRTASRPEPSSRGEEPASGESPSPGA